MESGATPKSTPPHRMNGISNKMAIPLSPANVSSLNANSPAPKHLTPSKLKTVHTHVPSNADEDEINWDEGPSSPFVTEIPEERENIFMSPARSSTAMIEKEVIQLDDEPAVPISVPQTPFQIAEDETSTFHTVKSSVSSSVRVSPSKSLYTRSSSYSSHHEEITSSTQVVDENQPVLQYPQQGRIEETDFAEITSLSADDSLTVDDTCFSTFSQVANTDMTAFAKLGQRSPTKQFMFDQVIQSYCRLTAPH